MGIDLVQVFLKVLNMSITAAYAAMFVCIARLALKKLPKVISYSLWLAVLFRLLCPVSFSSAISLLGLGNVSHASKGGSLSFVGNPVPSLSPVTVPQTAVSVSDGSPAAASEGPSVIETLASIAAIAWAAGVIVMLALSVISHIRLKHSISGAALLYGNVYESGNIPSPFVYGIIKPRIYLPAGMSGKDLEYVLSHERMHIARRDNVIKPIAYLTLCLHWFNPVMWAAFRLMCRDMEMSCDEKVLRSMEERDKTGYGEVLLRLASSRSVLVGSPLAFGESSVKARIKNVLAFRKPAFWIAAAAVIAAAAIGVCLIANPGPAAPASAEELYGNYRFEKKIYMNGLSSFLAFDGYEQYYTLGKDTLTIKAAPKERQVFDIEYNFSQVSEQDFKALFMSGTEEGPDISQYNQRYRYTLCEPAEYSPGYTLYFMDSEIWLARVNSGKDGVNYIWSIYRIEKIGGELPGQKPSVLLGPEAAPSRTIDPAETGNGILPRDVEITLYIGGDSDSDVPIEDETLKNYIQDIVIDYQTSPSTVEGVKVSTLDSYLVLSGLITGNDGQEYYYIFEKNGEFYIQGADGRCCITYVGFYNELLDAALGYGSPDTMTVVSGDNSVYALDNQLWTQLDNMHGAYPPLKPEQAAKYLQYLSIDPGNGEFTPFTPYINGKEVDGKYTIYSMDFEILAIVDSPPTESNEKRALLFNDVKDVKWPGKYIVELQATTEMGNIKFGNQYFFGVILPEKPEGQK